MEGGASVAQEEVRLRRAVADVRLTRCALQLSPRYVRGGLHVDPERRIDQRVSRLTRDAWRGHPPGGFNIGTPRDASHSVLVAEVDLCEGRLVFFHVATRSRVWAPAKPPRRTSSTAAAVAVGPAFHRDGMVRDGKRSTTEKARKAVS